MKNIDMATYVVCVGLPFLVLVSAGALMLANELIEWFKIRRSKKALRIQVYGA